MNDIEYLKRYYDGNIEDAINRLKAGEPVQYIVGNVDFYGNIFKVNKDVLIPRFETEQLVEKVINYSKKIFGNEKVDIVDLGCGSGCIAITLYQKLKCNVDAVDISVKALKVAKKNNKKIGTDVKFYCGDMLSPLEKKYNIIVSNPPYIAKNEKIMDIVKNNEPSIALYADDNGLFFYEQILKKANKYVKSKSFLAFEIGCTQKEELLKKAKLYFPKAEIFVEKDLQGKNRFLFIVNKKEQ